jgi:hypothetical protein
MTETSNQVPGPNEPDPDNVRLRSFQGGADGIGPTPSTPEVTYGQMKYMEDNGPGATAGAAGGGAGSGLSGLPAADAGTAPAQFNDPGAPDVIQKDPD